MTPHSSHTGWDIRRVTAENNLQKVLSICLLYTNEKQLPTSWRQERGAGQRGRGRGEGGRWRRRVFRGLGLPGFLAGGDGRQNVGFWRSKRNHESSGGHCGPVRKAAAKKRHGYYYEKLVGDFPLLQLSRRELVTLFLARQALATVRGTRLEQELSQTFERLTAGLSDEVSFSWSELDAAFSVRATGIVEADAHLFGTLSEAILQGREVDFGYQKLASNTAEVRRVRPYHLGQVDHGWYLFGFDLDREAVRTFALPRIADLKTSSTHFERPADFSLRNHLGGSFGVWNYAGIGDTEQDVKVVFRGYAARVIAERRWHPSQEIIDLKEGNGAIELRLRLRGLEEVARWVLSWGRWAEVLEPPELRRRVREEAAAITAGQDFSTTKGTPAHDSSLPSPDGMGSAILRGRG